MSDSKKLVIVVTNGFDNERSSVAWSIANGGVGMGFEVTMFLVSSGVDWVRKGAAAAAQLNPFDPKVGEMIENVVDSGANIYVCPPCAEVRGIGPEDLIDGAVIEGSGAIHRPILEGAATLCF